MIECTMHLINVKIEEKYFFVSSKHIKFTKKNAKKINSIAVAETKIFLKERK